ncbi:MAG: hypothetical protein JNG86_01155, partial [Verrucomicrobiaceae bacterium]|nr:hypothetical protein [Verrucomicrobiaceae bacterium]
MNLVEGFRVKAECIDSCGCRDHIFLGFGIFDHLAKRIERLAPRPAQNFALSFQSPAIAWRTQELNQLLILRLREIRQRLGFEALWLHLHDVTYIGSGPIKRRAFPTGAIDAAQAIDIGVGGAGHFDEGLGLAGFFEGGAFGLHLMMPESAAAPVAGEGG